MTTKISKIKLVWGLYGVLAVGIFLSAVSVKPARADDFDACTQNECNAGTNKANAFCATMGGALDWSTYDCVVGNPARFDYEFCCIINGTVNCTYVGYCD